MRLCSKINYPAGCQSGQAWRGWGGSFHSYHCMNAATPLCACHSQSNTHCIAWPAHTCCNHVRAQVDDNLGFAKDRTISRLTEMQSLEYLLTHAHAHAPEYVLALEEAAAKAAAAAAAAKA